MLKGAGGHPWIEGRGVGPEQASGSVSDGFSVTLIQNLTGSESGGFGIREVWNQIG